VAHVADNAYDLALRWFAIVAALTLDNDVLAKRLCSWKEAARQMFIDDDDRRRVPSVAAVEGPSAGERYLERAKIIGLITRWLT